MDDIKSDIKEVIEELANAINEGESELANLTNLIIQYKRKPELPDYYYFVKGCIKSINRKQRILRNVKGMLDGIERNY